MKSRKLRFLKTVGLLTGAITIIGTPIIVTSCSNQDNSNNNTNKPGNDNNPGQGGDSTNKKVPQLQKDITLDVPYTDIFVDGHVNVQQSLDKYFGNNENLQKYITNKDNFTAEELKTFTASVDSTLNDTIKANNFWGKTNYDAWSKDKKSYIFEPKQSLHVDLNKGIKTLLNDSEKLTQIAKDSGIDVNAKTVSLDENKQPKVENNSLNVAVSITDKDKATVTDVSVLEIPFSSTILDISNLDLTINSSKDQTRETTEISKQQVNVDLDVAINSKAANEELFEKGFVMPKDKKTVNTNDFITSFNLNKVSTAVINKHSITNTENKEVKSENVEIDNKKVSDFFEIYNVDFANFRIEEIAPKTTPGTDGYTGLFNIKADATPKTGYKWEDGSTIQKTISQENISIKVRVSDWSLNDIVGKDFNFKGDITLSSDDQKGADAYFEEESKREAFLNKYAKQLTDAKILTNCDLKFLSVHWLSSKKIQARVQAIPKQGCEFKDIHKEDLIIPTEFNTK